MIARRMCLSMISFIVVAGFGFQAWSEELSDKYLLGKWVLNEPDCSDSSSEFVILRGNGAVEDVRAGKLEAAGFWELDDDIMVFNVVASPAFFHDAREDAVDLKAFKGEYLAFGVRVVPFELEPDRFDAVGILGNQIIKSVFHRCKS